MPSRIFICLFFVVTQSFSVFAAPGNSRSVELLRLSDGVSQYQLSPYAEVLEDEAGKLTVEEVIDPSTNLEWQANKAETPNFAFSSSAYWLRIGFQSDMPTHKTWLFEVAFPLHDYLDYYVVQNNQVLAEVQTGDRRPFHSRSFDYRNYLFELDMPAKATHYVYLRMATHDGLHEPTPMILWDQQAFGLENGWRNLGLGLFYGIMLVMALYNLFIYFSVRDPAYFWYVGYIGFFSAWLLSYYGFSYQFFWPGAPVLANQVIVVLICGWTVCMIQFIRSFLDTKRFVPWMEPICRVYLLLILIVLATRVFDHYAFGILAVIFLGGPACLLAIVAGVSCWRKGYRPAFYFLVAWSVLLISITIFCMKAGGLLPSSWLIERAVQIGCVLEVVMLSLGLADRINELKRQAFHAQKKSLEVVEANLKLRNDFITSITHELRTPMNAVIGGLQLAEGHNQTKLEPPFDIVKAGANDMMRLINDILIHTEIQAGKLEMKSENTAIRKLLAPIMVYYEKEASLKGVEFIHDIDSAVPDLLKTDGHKILTILRKLLDNGVKFTEKGTVKLTINLKQDTDQWQLILVVEDTGPGIPSYLHADIFKPFMQAEGGFERRHGGVGIGLCICENLVNRLGGEIAIDSEVGKGSRFLVKLPVALGEASIEEEIHPVLAGDLPVLVVEDNMVNQMVIVKMLKSLGLEAILANQGREALVLLDKLPVSLILMDLQMPVMDGFNCAKTIRQRNDKLKDIPIIAVSANLMDVDKSRCVASGMNDFLEKPVKLHQLRDSIGRYIQLDKKVD